MLKETSFPSIENNAHIIKPPICDITIPQETDYVFIFRKDGKFSMSPISLMFSADYKIDSRDVNQVLQEEYDIFFHKLTNIMSWGHASKGNFEIHLFEPDDIDKVIRKKAGTSQIISLDPLLHEEGIRDLNVSRGYFPGGKKTIGQVARPGADRLSEQINKIKREIGSRPSVLVDDDFFRGVSIQAALTELESAGINISTIMPGIKVGNTESLTKRGYKVDPVVSYKRNDGLDPLEKINLADPRDYLMGVSGLVTKLPDGSLGRSPYVIPFVPPSEKTGIPSTLDNAFSQFVLQANLEFFQRVEQKLGKPLLIKHMDPHFMRMMHDVYGFDNSTPVKHVVAWSMNHAKEIWQYTQDISSIEQIRELNLPKRLIFLDVNGTLIPEDKTEQSVDKNEWIKVRDLIDILKKKGIMVGLCSDSSADKLKHLAQTISATGPIIAENGNVILHDGQKILINTLTDIAKVKNNIRESLRCLEFTEVRDELTHQFGGKHADYERKQWAFGSGRETSISLYAPAEIISLLTHALLFEDNVSIESNPEHNYLSIHPGSIETNKARTLSLVKASGHDILMIGNSISDWMPSESGVKVAFVKSGDLPMRMRNKGDFSSRRNDIEGVIDILTKIAYAIPKEIDLEEKLTGGEMNILYRVKWGEKEAIMQLSNGFSRPEFQHLTTYLSANKLDKVKALEPILLSYGISIPKIIASGRGSPTPWILQEIANGRNLSEIYDSLKEEEKLKVARNMAIELAKIHTIPLESIPPIYDAQNNESLTSGMRHKEKMLAILDTLKTNGFLTQEEQDKYANWQIQVLKDLPQSNLTLTHRDFFQRNIFVNEETLQIDDIIDWSDTAGIGDPLMDATLSASWIAGNLEIPENREVFNTFIKTYASVRKINLSAEFARSILRIFAVEWNLEAAIYFAFKKDSVQLEKHLNRIKKLIDE